MADLQRIEKARSEAQQVTIDTDGCILLGERKLHRLLPGGQEGFLMVAKESLDPKATLNVEMTINLNKNAPIPTKPFVAGFNRENPPASDTYTCSISLQIYDSLGKDHTMTIYFRNTNEERNHLKSWDIYIAIDGVDVTLLHYHNGCFINFELTGEPPRPIICKLGAVSVLMPELGTLHNEGEGLLNILPELIPGLTYIGDDSRRAIKINLCSCRQSDKDFKIIHVSQDGYPAAKATGAQLDKDGTVTEQFGNGQCMLLGKVRL